MAGCRAHGAPGVEECSPVEGALAGDDSSSGLEGEYQLTVVGSRSGESDSSATGGLVLEPNDSAHIQRLTADGEPIPGVLFTHYGWTDVPIEQIGGLALGQLDSRDPDAPGVLVIENRQLSNGEPYLSITIRLGSQANAVSAARFDEGFSALYVKEVLSDRIRGDWASGDGRGRVAEGHFCARRSD
jgi:hypothetical protein